MAKIRVENLRKSFDQFTAVHDSDFTIESGTFFAPTRVNSEIAAHCRIIPPSIIRT